MTVTGSEIEASLKSVYGDRWRQGLLVHILIGLGKGLIERRQTHSPLLSKKEGLYDGDLDEHEEAIKELQENPLEYIRMMSEKLADELEALLRETPRGSVKQVTDSLYPDFGELMEAIGVQARLRLEGSGDDELATLLESVVQVAWEESSPVIREDMLKILRLLDLFSASI